MIPSALEHLLLTGKAKHEIYSFVGGSLGAINIQPDKVVIIYQITIFPFTEQLLDTEASEQNPIPESTVFELVLNSEGNREVIPFKFAFDVWEDSRGLQGFKWNYPPRGSAVVLPVFTICRNKLIFDIRKLVLRFANDGEGTPTPAKDGIQQHPQQPEGISTIKYINFSPNGATDPVNYSYDLWPNETEAYGQNHPKPEFPANNDSVLKSMYQYFQFSAGSSNEINDNSCPVILFNAVLINSSAYDKLLHT
jgi:hypothetical protein